MITLPSGRKIGEGQPPFVIAEVGSNFQTLEHCLHSISMAKQCGADAVKFQAYTHSALYGWAGEAPHSLPASWLPSLKTKADACGIEFMCSAFSPELVSEVDKYVNIHKVASAEMTHVRMLEKLREIGKPVILSTGASGEADIRQALFHLGATNSTDPLVSARYAHLPKTPTVLMYCVAAYPARIVDLTVIESMRSAFKLPIGFSDHTTDVMEIPYMADVRGACVIEKHANFEGVDSPDAPHSLTTDEFKIMVQVLRGKYQVIGTMGVSPEETAMVIRHNRRLIATRDIPLGTELREGENFGIYRSLKDDTHALSPFMIGLVHGQSAKRAIKAGDGIGPGDF